MFPVGREEIVDPLAVVADGVGDKGVDGVGLVVSYGAVDEFEARVHGIVGVLD